MDVVFQWNNSITEEEVCEFEKKIGYSLPKSYVEFLKISDGAILFKDALFGQWGYDLVSIDSIIETTNNIRNLGYNIPMQTIVIAKSFGDGDFILIDLIKAKNNDDYLIDGEQGYQYDDWEVIKGKFDKFIDRLIVAQGAKYWRWK